MARCPHEPVQADAFEWLGEDTQRKFDLVVLDPPSFAPREADRANAIRSYGRLVSLGIGRLARGGILVACSCSAHVSADEFFQVVRRCAVKSGQRLSNGGRRATRRTTGDVQGGGISEGDLFEGKLNR